MAYADSLLSVFQKTFHTTYSVDRRTSYLYDHLNLPAVINEMAVNTLLGNMDRCTKNFYVYYNPDTDEWSRSALWGR